MTKINFIAQIKALFPVAQVFMSLSVMFGTWIIYIPHICEKLSLSEGQLGLAFLIGSCGSLTSVFLGKPLCQVLGEGKTTFLSSIVSFSLIAALFLVGDKVSFWILWFVYGMSGGILQVSLNAMTVLVEEERGEPIMSKCHGFYSLGGLLSTGFGTALVLLFKNPLMHVFFVLGLTVTLQLIYGKRYWNLRSNSSAREVSKPKFQLNNPLLWGICFIALVVMVAEGAVADWSALYLKTISQTRIEIVGLGYAGFSLAMTIFRFGGDQLRKKWSAWRIITSGLLLSLIGFGVVLLRDPVFTMVGFFIVGSGFSVIVPELYRQAANLKDVHAASGIATIAASGYVGFLVGPFLMGTVAEEFNLLISFATMTVFVSSAFALSVFIGRRQSDNTSSESELGQCSCATKC